MLQGSVFDANPFENAPFIIGKSERGYGFGEALFTRRAALRPARYDMK